MKDIDGIEREYANVSDGTFCLIIDIVELTEIL